MIEKRRHTLGVLAALVAAYAGFRYFPDIRPTELNFDEVHNPLGFRRLSVGESSGGFDPFFGLIAPNTDILAEAEARVRADICGALYGDFLSETQLVPAASFSDYYCPFCRVQTKTLAALDARTDSNLHVNWHELPLLGQPSDIAAKAALAAKRQGAYVAFHERLMKSPFVATPEYLQALAQDIGIDHRRLVADMQGAAVVRELENSAALAKVFGFIGTPALVIGRTVIQGQVDEATILRIAEMEIEENWTSQC
ncbi:DsbA family protein [Aliiroseovarius sp. S1339]|uniref:DsbA family protein n=1 Tax=Aliiroseovarius sp. S1339 TaxID=2936990 RepID=UPI0020C010DB|nr:DsbA family protein [Aliiroseovarius sp. S1339]MCK8463089.1 DsbA family protein [Aliiroseovarius sp. S1339]